MKKMILSLVTLMVLGTSTGYCSNKVDYKGGHSKNQKQEMVMKSDCHKKHSSKHSKHNKHDEHGKKTFDCKMKENKHMK